jgi:hypothetical protein
MTARKKARGGAPRKPAARGGRSGRRAASKPKAAAKPAKPAAAKKKSAQKLAPRRGAPALPAAASEADPLRETAKAFAARLMR